MSRTSWPGSGPVLMTPGPTRVPERVLRAGARPMIHHRSPAFSDELASLLENIGPVFGTTSKVLPVHTTGRGALEATIANLFAPGDELAICCNGKFGEMWAGYAESYGLVVHRFGTDWARQVEVADVEAVLHDHPKVRAVTVAYGETSTGARIDVAGVARAAQQAGVLSLVDGVSTIGGAPFEFDAWGVDVAITASQKCLMSSPGLAFVALSDRAWKAYERGTLPRNYWNFADVRRTLSALRPETPGTAPVHLVLQVAEALRVLHDEGLRNVYERHEEMSAIARRGIAELGLAVQCPAFDAFSPTVTAVALPVGLAPKAVRDAIKARGYLTAAAMGPFESTGFRIGHMGDIRPADVLATLAALREALVEVRASAAR